MLRRRHRRLTAWLAVAAMIWVALGPSLSHAWMRAMAPRQAPWLVICSAADAGEPGASSRTRSSEDSGTLTHVAGHCVCCGGVAVDLGLAPPALAVPRPAAPRESWAGCAAVARAEAYAWRAGQPRAPPAAA